MLLPRETYIYLIYTEQLRDKSLAPSLSSGSMVVMGTELISSPPS